MRFAGILSFMTDPVERVFAKVNVEETTDCWLWTGSLSHGYANAWLGGRVRPVHRYMWEVAHGEPVPVGLELDHLCRQTNCINPAHLEPVPHAENVRRGAAGSFQRNKTQCPSGHPYEGKNLQVSARGFRKCRTCGREGALRLWREKNPTAPRRK